MWHVSWKADPVANAVAKRHYTCQSPQSKQFVPPGRALVLRTLDGGAVWVTSWPMAEYVRHAWAGAWTCSLFRNERPDLYLSSALIREAVAITRDHFGIVPEHGMVTFINRDMTRPKRNPGYCYLMAGFTPLAQRTKDLGLYVVQMREEAMPDPRPPDGVISR